MESAENNKELGLKHLGFMRVAAIQLMVCASDLYNYAKQNSGPLKSAVGKVEGAVTAVVTPVYDKFKDVPDTLLVYLDHKVGEASCKFEKHAPPTAKRVASQAQVLIYKATEKAQNFVKEARTGGPKAAFNYAATEYKYFVVTNSVKVWAKLNQYKPIHVLGEKALPVAANLSTTYNDLVTDMSQMGYRLVGYLPLVPIDDIVKVMKRRMQGKSKEMILLKSKEINLILILIEISVILLPLGRIWFGYMCKCSSLRPLLCASKNLDIHFTKCLIS